MTSSKVSCCLSPLERAGVLVALEEAADALTNCRLSLQKHSLYLPDDAIDYVFAEEESEATLDSKIIDDDLTKDFRDQMTRLKLQRDSLYAERMLRDLMEEVRREGSFRRLIEENESISGLERLERRVVEESEESERALGNLQRSLSQRKLENEEKEKRLTEKFLRTQSEKETLKATAKSELKYVAAWEKARCEQNSLRCKIDLDHLDSTLKNCFVGEKNENRVSTEVMAFLIQKTASIEERIELWRRRYEEEKVAYEKGIREAEDEIETRRSVLKELRDEYHSNQEFIDTYLGEKEAARRRREEDELRRESATRIQAWWRGVMVRRKLGPYRPEEKKKKRSVKTKK